MGVSIPTATVQTSGRRAVVAVWYGVICHTGFVLALASMMVAMYYGMSRSLGRVPQPWGWVANAALLLAFPVLHSILLSTRGRAVLARLAPAGTGATLSTTTYVIIASAQVLALFALWTPSGTIWWHARSAGLAAVDLLYAASWLLLGKAILDAGLNLHTGSIGWTALLRGSKPMYPQMPSTGLFRFTRQPIYVAFALTVWTVPTWTPDQLAVALTLTAYCLIGPLFKEARFRRVHGSAFDSYASAVPYWLPWPRKSG